MKRFASVFIVILTVIMLTGCQELLQTLELAQDENTDNIYTVTYDGNNSSAEGTMTPQVISNGSTVNLSVNTFSKTGWTFAGWATTSDGSVVYNNGASYTIGTESVTLYAKWTLSLNLMTDWYREGSGSWETVAEGIKVYGTADRSTSAIYCNDNFSLFGTDIYIKWLVHGNNTYASYAFNMLDSGRTVGLASHDHSFSTNNSFSGTKLVSDDTWYYTHYRINSDKTFNCVTSTGNYDDNFGVIVYSDSLIVTEANWLVADSSIMKCRIEDNHGGVSAFFIIGEIIIIH